MPAPAADLAALLNEAEAVWIERTPATVDIRERIRRALTEGDDAAGPEQG